MSHLVKTVIAVVAVAALQTVFAQGTSPFKLGTIFLKAGDVSVCGYEGIGTLTNPIVAPRAAGSR